MWYYPDLKHVGISNWAHVGNIVWLILISWGSLTSFFLAMCYFDWPIVKKVETMEAAPNRRFHWKMGQTYGIKARSKGEYPWGTHWELDGNPLGTWREHKGNIFGRKEKWKNSSLTPTQNLNEKKFKAPWVHASVFPLAACIFGCCWSPFLA